MQLVITTILIGIALGHLFKALILLPAIATVSGFVLSVGFIDSVTFGSIAVKLLLAVAGLQIGYLIGMAGVHFWRATRTRSRPSWRLAPAKQPARAGRSRDL